jgi:hypothetical protein
MGDDTLGSIGDGMAIALFMWHSRNTGRRGCDDAVVGQDVLTGLSHGW